MQNVTLIYWLFGLAALTILLLILVPLLQVRRLKGFLKPEELFDKENQARVTLAQMIAGLALMVTIYSSVQTQASSDRTQQNAIDQLTLAREGQLSERFTKAVEQLANRDSLVRIGGLLTLERAAQLSPERYHWTMVEVITEFIRNHAPARTGAGCAAKDGPSKDVYIALKVLGRRDVAHDPRDRTQNRLFLAELDLCHAYLSRLNLAYAEFQDARLANALFRETDLKNTWLQRSDLKRAFMQGADLSGADLSDADLTQAELPGANLSGAVLNNAELRDACFDDADLSLANGLTQLQVNSAIGNLSTKLPNHLSRPASWKAGRVSCRLP